LKGCWFLIDKKRDHPYLSGNSLSIKSTVRTPLPL
jgi:hypothetical protein